MNWLKELYEKLRFQDRYNFFKNLKWSPSQQALIDNVWATLGPTIQKALWSLVAMILAKYGPEAAQEIFSTVLAKIKEKGYIVS